MAAKVDPPAGAQMLSQFKNTVADGFAITEGTYFETTQADTQLRLHRLILNRFEPLRERLLTIGRLISEDFEHAIL